MAQNSPAVEVRALDADVHAYRALTGQASDCY